VSTIKRNGTWVLPGIRDYSAGDWVDNIELIGDPSTQPYYPIFAAIQSVTWDFSNQETIIGGLINEDQY
jgi:hypothetical protein